MFRSHRVCLGKSAIYGIIYSFFLLFSSSWRDQRFFVGCKSSNFSRHTEETVETEIFSPERPSNFRNCSRARKLSFLFSPPTLFPSFVFIRILSFFGGIFEAKAAGRHTGDIQFPTNMYIELYNIRNNLSAYFCSLARDTNMVTQ